MESSQNTGNTQKVLSLCTGQPSWEDWFKHITERRSKYLRHRESTRNLPACSAVPQPTAPSACRQAWYHASVCLLNSLILRSMIFYQITFKMSVPSSQKTHHALLLLNNAFRWNCSFCEHHMRHYVVKMWGLLTLNHHLEGSHATEWNDTAAWMISLEVQGDQKFVVHLTFVL